MTKKRDKAYGPKPQDVPLKQEELPRSPSRMRSGYCKKAKGAHEFELDEVRVYKHLGNHPSHPMHGPLYVKGLTNYKIYRCITCGKKKMEQVVYQFDEPVLYEKEGDKL